MTKGLETTLGRSLKIASIYAISQRVSFKKSFDSAKKITSINLNKLLQRVSLGWRRWKKAIFSISQILYCRLKKTLTMENYLGFGESIYRNLPWTGEITVTFNTYFAPLFWIFKEWISELFPLSTPRYYPYSQKSAFDPDWRKKPIFVPSDIKNEIS
jgi:hypothetical protein